MISANDSGVKSSTFSLRAQYTWRVAIHASSRMTPSAPLRSDQPLPKSASPQAALRRLSIMMRSPITSTARRRPSDPSLYARRGDAVGSMRRLPCGGGTGISRATSGTLSPAAFAMRSRRAASRSRMGMKKDCHSVSEASAGRPSAISIPVCTAPSVSRILSRRYDSDVPTDSVARLSAPPTAWSSASRRRVEQLSPK